MTITNKTTKRAMSGWLGAVLAAAVLAGCGGTQGGQSTTTQQVGPQGATLSLGSALQIEIPAGAVQAETEIHVTEVEPRPDEVKAFHIEPPLDSSAGFHVKAHVDQSMGNGKHHLVEVENEVEHAAENEVENENEVEHAVEADFHHLDHLGVKNVNP